jgi:hypothetical protein
MSLRARIVARLLVLGDQPVTTLEKPAEVLRFKAAYRKGREVATVNRALSTLESGAPAATRTRDPGLEG